MNESKYRVVLLNKDGHSIVDRDADTIKEAKKLAKYLLSDGYARYCAESTHLSLQTFKVEIRNRKGECLHDWFHPKYDPCRLCSHPVLAIEKTGLCDKCRKEIKTVFVEVRGNKLAFDLFPGFDLDHITRRLTCFETFDQLLNPLGGTYRPSIYIGGRIYQEQCDLVRLTLEYNTAQEARGDDRRVYQGDWRIENEQN